MSKHSCRLITFCFMNLAIVSVLRLNNTRVFIHSVRLFRAIIIVFIISEENMCTQFMLIFFKRCRHLNRMQKFFSVELSSLTIVIINDISFTILILIALLISISYASINIFLTFIFVFVMQLFKNFPLIFTLIDNSFKKYVFFLLV